MAEAPDLTSSSGNSIGAGRGDLGRYLQDRVEAAALDEIILGIASSLDVTRTLQSIVEAAAALAEASVASIYLRDRNVYRPMAAFGTPLEELHPLVLGPDQGLLPRMERTRQPVQVTDFPEQVKTTREAHDAAERTGVHATLGVPLLRGDECHGALYVASQRAEPFPPETAASLERLAAFAEIAVQNAQHFSDVSAERAKLQAYLDAIPEGVLIYSRRGDILLANESWRRLMRTQVSPVGVDRHDLLTDPEKYVGRPLTFHYDRDAVFQRVISTGKPEQGLMMAGDPDTTFEVNYSALRDGDRVIGVVCTIRDITAPLELERTRSRAHLLAQLLDLSARLNSNLSVQALTEHVVDAAMELIGASAGGLGLVEEDGLVYRRFRAASGWTDFQITLQPGEGAPGYVWQTMQPYIANDCRSDPHVLQGAREELGFKRLVYVPIIDRSGKIIGTLGVYDPVVERDFAQQDVEALQLLAHQVSIALENARLSELKDAFLSIVSHELKTPVTSIKGFTQVLQRRLSPESRESSSRYLTIINQQADRLTALINDLLDLSRIQTGRFEFDLAPVDFDHLVRDVINEMQMIAPHNRVTLTASEGIAVNGNSDRLRQVLVNLIDNAIKHGPVGSDVHVTVERHGREVATYVCDQGSGLPAGEEERIFGPYYQVRGTAAQHAKGLGLGLFISRRIVESHGGRIWVDSEDHTSFCFTVPASDETPGQTFRPQPVS